MKSPFQWEEGSKIEEKVIVNRLPIYVHTMESFIFIVNPFPSCANQKFSSLQNFDDTNNTF